MKRFLPIFLLVILLVVSFIWSNYFTAQKSGYDSPEISKHQTPKVKELSTKNGLRAWIIEDHYLPIVSVNLTFRNSGSAYDPIAKLGIANFAASTIDEGAGELNSLQYRKKLEDMATTLSFSVDEDNFYVSIKTLKENLAESLKIANWAMSDAHFTNETIERIRNQILVVLEKQKESPEYIAARKFKETIFGEHPYGRQEYGVEETLRSLTRDDLVSYTKDNFTNENVEISVVGDVTKGEVIELLDSTLTLFSDKIDIVKLPPVRINKSGQTIYIERDIPQSIVIFGGEGIVRSDEMFYASYLMNHILGGGGGESRLMQEVREKQGLAYSTYSYLELLHEAGLFVGYVGTDGDKVEKSIALIKEQLKEMAVNGVSEIELEDAKSYLINSFPLKMTKNEKLAAFLSVMQSNNLGVDFLEQRNSYVKAVTSDDIQRSAKALLNPDNMLFVVVGNKK